MLVPGPTSAPPGDGTCSASAPALLSLVWLFVRSLWLQSPEVGAGFTQSAACVHRVCVSPRACIPLEHVSLFPPVSLLSVLWCVCSGRAVLGGGPVGLFYFYWPVAVDHSFHSLPSALAPSVCRQLGDTDQPSPQRLNKVRVCSPDLSV